jgi:hypothetical protein
MLKTIAAIAVAGIFLTAIDLGTDGAVETAGPQRASKGNRLPIGPACSQAAWPYYESKCVRDTTPPQGRPQEVRVVRIISTDGLAGRHPVVSLAD